MAYEKQTWVCGDVITADRLNHMEEGIEECCGSAGGYTCTEEVVPLTEESVTTTKFDESDLIASAELSYTDLIDANEIRVTFNGVEYECDRIDVGVPGVSVYGGADAHGEADFSEYPFMLECESGLNTLLTETAGTYQIKIEAVEAEVEVSSCFRKAVETVTEDSPSPSGESISIGVPQNSFLQVVNFSAKPSDQVTIPANEYRQIHLLSSPISSASEIIGACINSVKGSTDNLLRPISFSTYVNSDKQVDVSVVIYNGGSSAYTITAGSSDAYASGFCFYKGANRETLYCAIKGVCEDPN